VRANPAAGADRVLERLHRAMNEHDVEAFLANVDADYRSEQPAHPERAFGGREQVRENWQAIFQGVPDFRAELIRSAVDGERVWAEWGWRGTRTDGSRLGMSGVTIFGVRAERIVWGRLYMEMIETGGGDIGEAMERMTAPPPNAERPAGRAGEAQPSGTETNKVVARRFGEEVWGRGDVQAAEEMLAEDFIEHNPVPGQGPGREGHRQVLKVWRAAFPDLTITVDDLLADGDRVGLRWTAHATHRGELMGMPATGAV
jgi:predicted ester cyclase/limonene-1,2-epoxide hydrolase